MPVIQRDRGEDVRVGVLRVLFGGLHGLIVFAYVGLGMNFQWETHVLLGLVLVAVALGSWLFILWASLLKTTRRIPWALYMCGAAGIGVLVAFHVDGTSERNIAIAHQTADRMSRQLQGEVRDRAGIDWLQPQTPCTVEVTGIPGLTPWMEMGWSRLSSPDPHRLGPCRVQVRCGEATIYGAGTSGYLSCRLGEDDSLAVQDVQGTALDTDPRLRLDTRDGRVEVQDDSIGAAPPYRVSIAVR